MDPNRPPPYYDPGMDVKPPGAYPPQPYPPGPPAPYGPPTDQQYAPPPGPQYAPPPGPQYAPPPAQQYAPPMGQQYGPSPPQYAQAPSQTVMVAAQPQPTVVVAAGGGNCVRCGHGILDDSFPCCAVFLAIIFFPLGILCCLAMREKRCTTCGARY